MKNLQALILAAGKSTRFNTQKSKLLHTICGQEMILYPANTLKELAIPSTFIVGNQKDAIQETVKKAFPAATFVEQKEQRGTGHAILCTRDHWNQDNILIMNGDMPLVTAEIINELYKKHMTTNAAVSFVIAHNVDPTGKSYGRVVQSDSAIEIIEAKHFDGDPHEHCYINAGIYLVQRSFLEDAISSIEKNDITQEFYFTDLIKIASEQGKTVSTTYAPFDRIRGINTLEELWAVEQVKRSDLIRYWMSQGVRFTVPQNVHLDLAIEIGAGTTIGGGVHILQKSSIGKNCTIHGFSSIENSTLHDNATIEPHCVIKDATIGAHSAIGPFAHIRENSVIHDHCSIGNFVEMKNTSMGTGSKARHLAYLGDAIIGSHVNIGAGTITCNYDGVEKHTTIIKDNAFIGSNNTLVAPVTIENDAFTAAGSVITDMVPEKSLAIGRSRQTNKPGYAEKLRTKNEKKKINRDEPTSFVGARKTNSREKQGS